MVKSLLDLSSVDPGFETTGTLSVGLDLLSQVDAEPVERAQTLAAFLDRFAALPGVEAVGAIDYFPLKNRSGSVGISLEGQSVEEARLNPAPQFGRTTPGYFEAMGIARLRGNDFDSVLPHVARKIGVSPSRINARRSSGWKITIRATVTIASSRSYRYTIR